jgi:hypothetical protein
MWKRREVLSLLAGTPVMSQGHAQSPRSFNDYIMLAVEFLSRERKNNGYDINRAYSQDLNYDGSRVIRATRPLVSEIGLNPSMCVAAVAEIIIEAINIYHEQNKLRSTYISIYEKLPARHWNQGNLRAIRSHIFMYRGTDSRGTGSALRKFGIGSEKNFSELVQGDFINLNRSRTGHAVVFVNYLTSSGPHNVYTDDVIGFRYFSCQGSGRADAGFGYRNAYFDGQCPRPRSRDDDCGIIKAYRMESNPPRFQQNQRLLNCGRMFHPEDWQIENAMAQFTRETRGMIENQALTRGLNPDDVAESLLNVELEPSPELYVDGTFAE